MIHERARDIRPKVSNYVLGATGLLLVLLAITVQLWTLPTSAAAPPAPRTPKPPGVSVAQAPDKPLPKGEQGDGSLRIVNEKGAGEFCPLKHTDVDAEISGFLARVTVTQEFVNPSTDKVEAIYTFPLPQDSAVDDMTMEVGGRVVRGLIKKREEAQQIYNNAKRTGHTAALLDQERPNIFTQSVANIPPGSSVKVRISYSEVLKYDAGVYEFVYPMVVGPRYIPGNITGKQAGGFAHDTDQVPDASRITPKAAGVHWGQRGTRAGHDISLQVRLDAGVDIREVKSLLHNVDVQHRSAHSATVRLKNEGEIPNRDFVLKYDVGSGKIADALLTHAIGRERDDRGGGDSNATRGFFSFILQPPDRVADEDATARELIFVLDTSGSMYGFPLNMAKKTMRRAIENMRPGDTFNFITFAGDTRVLFPQPVAPTAANIKQAIAFMESQQGGGGTEMMKAIRTALGDSFECPPNADCLAPKRVNPAAVRIVCFMTDGYVGNDMAILGEIQKHPDARVFSFGIGTAVNRFLLDKMAEVGRGEAEFVTREEDAKPAADRFYERVHTPVLTDISIDWNGLPVTDVLPAKPLDLFSAKPLVITGRYTSPASGTIKLRGKRAGRPFERAIKVTLPGRESDNQSLAQLWARTKIHELMNQDWEGAQNQNMRAGLKDAITQLGLDYRLMTQFTSFVAVEEQTVVDGGRTRTIQVPVEVPQGVNPDTAYGVGAGTGAGVAGGVAKSMSAPSSYNYATTTVELSAAQSNATDKLSGSRRDSGTVSRAMTVDGAQRLPENEPKDEKGRKEADQKKALESKLHPSLLSVYECWVKAGRSKTANCAGLRNGAVKVQVFFTSNSAAALQSATQKGFFAAPNSTLSDRMSGTIAIEKLEELAKLPEVKLIALER